jgi:hypothetical protein
MKSILLGCALFIGVSGSAAQFTVNDALAGSGTLDLPQGLAKVVGWPEDPGFFSLPFSGSGRFADGTVWSSGQIRDARSFTGDCGLRFFFKLYLAGGSVSVTTVAATEVLLYDRPPSGGGIDDVTIIDNGQTFTPSTLPPGDDSNGDFQYLLDQSAAHFPLVNAPEHLGSWCFVAVLSGLWFVRHRLRAF